MRFRNSLLKQFIAISIIISLIIGTYFTLMLVYMNNSSLRTSTRAMNDLHYQLVLRINEYYTNIENQVFALSYSPVLQEFMQADSTQERLGMLADLHTVQSGVFFSLSSLTGISTYDVTGNIIGQTGENIFTAAILPKQYLNIVTNHYTDVYQSLEISGIRKDSFAVLTPVYTLIRGTRLLGENLGIVTLTFNLEFLQNLLNTGALAGQYMSILTDRTGHIIATNTAEARDYFTNQTWEHTPPAASTLTVLDKSGWRLYSFMPRSVITEEMQPLLALTLTMGSVFLFLLILLLIMVQKQVIRPILKLSVFMSRVPQDQSPVRFQSRYQNELGMMTQVMNQMLDDLDIKNKQISQSEVHLLQTELARKEMEILAYRNQINPHFLYNTLDCIRGMALYYDIYEIASISESLSTMFRYGVKGGDFATVEQEAQYIQEYTTIINYRFMDRIRIELDVDPEAMNYRILKLTLQPIVENAVFHGLEKRVGPGIINVSVQLHNNTHLVSVVQDDGVGIDDVKLSLLRKSIDEAKNDGSVVPTAEGSIGITNIARRLHLYYGGECEINIDSVTGHGTRVEIRLPLHGDRGK